jgi:8-oxo-dGTP pyrophosphatase MutT (NUDIX family)
MTDYFLGGEGQLTPGNAAVALIVLEDGRYLMQHRDQKPGIFYPGHWGLFGGAIDADETPEIALRRELEEELGLSNFTPLAITDFTFRFGRYGHIARYFFEVRLSGAKFNGLRLGEGYEMRPFLARDILTKARVVPYDSFAIWLHASGWIARISAPPAA